MSEISLNVSGYGGITVRLDPNEIVGRNLAGQPALYLPFKIQCLPIPTQKAALSYTIVRFTGNRKHKSAFSRHTQRALQVAGFLTSRRASDHQAARNRL